MANKIFGAKWIGLCAFFLAVLVAPAFSNAQITALRGARLIDGTGRPAFENSIVVIDGDKIQAVGSAGSIRIPKGAKVLDLSGKTILPLLICLHGHLGQTRDGAEGEADAYTSENVNAQLEQYLRYGVGTVVSLGADQDVVYDLRAQQRAGNPSGARLYTAGRGFGVRGGFPPGMGHPRDVYRPETADQARADVRELAAHHPDFVKIWVDDNYGRLPKMEPQIYRAIIEKAHRHNLRVLAHVFYLADAKALIAAGVDGLAHSVRDLPVDEELIAAMKVRGVFLIPTLVRDESTFTYADGPVWLTDPFFRAGVAPGVLSRLENGQFKPTFQKNPDLNRYRAALEMAKENLKALFDAGVQIGFGTDSGPPLRFQGYLEHRELQLMVESGLTPGQALRIATEQSAKILRADDFGTLEPGKQADFMVLAGDPLENIHNTGKLSALWQRGKPVPFIHAE
jgi:imidazolonepropionase-like amidohydrolase